mmetsp:Transcript_5079/g.7764  ORF Transcript_5079/g.7764 Transcript_5079/m.7764 type:complete len:213 (+) Transcript_5079:377-1015(+)
MVERAAARTWLGGKIELCTVSPLSAFLLPLRDFSEARGRCSGRLPDLLAVEFRARSGEGFSLTGPGLPLSSSESLHSFGSYFTNVLLVDAALLLVHSEGMDFFDSTALEYPASFFSLGGEDPSCFPLNRVVVYIGAFFLGTFIASPLTDISVPKEEAGVSRYGPVYIHSHPPVSGFSPLTFLGVFSHSLTSKTTDSNSTRAFWTYRSVTFVL